MEYKNAIKIIINLVTLIGIIPCSLNYAYNLETFEQEIG